MVFDQDLKKKNWFNIGGKSKVFFKADNLKDLVKFLQLLDNQEKIFIIGEIGINHNGSLKKAKELILLAKRVGFDAVKFQKRTPEITTPKSKANLERETPWGKITYLEYKKKIEKD